MGKLAKKAVKIATFGTVAGKVNEKREEKKKAAAMPETPVATLPDDEEIRRSTRRAAALRMGALGSGRASTILSNDSGKLGA